jgi:hypothetical protein
MTIHEDAVHAQIAEIDRQAAFIHRVEDFYAGITYRAEPDEPYVPSADLVDAATAAGASTSRQFGDIYMRLVAAKRGAGHIEGKLL